MSQITRRDRRRQAERPGRARAESTASSIRINYKREIALVMPTISPGNGMKIHGVFLAEAFAAPS
jgi:hypothetical protein